MLDYFKSNVFYTNGVEVTKELRYATINYLIVAIVSIAALFSVSFEMTGGNWSSKGEFDIPLAYIVVCILWVVLQTQKQTLISALLSATWWVVGILWMPLMALWLVFESPSSFESYIFIIGLSVFATATLAFRMRSLRRKAYVESSKILTEA